jgi:hypothetical protein
MTFEAFDFWDATPCAVVKLTDVSKYNAAASCTPQRHFPEVSNIHSSRAWVLGCQLWRRSEDVWRRISPGVSTYHPVIHWWDRGKFWNELVRKGRNSADIRIRKFPHTCPEPVRYVRKWNAKCNSFNIPREIRSSGALAYVVRIFIVAALCSGRVKEMCPVTSQNEIRLFMVFNNGSERVTTTILLTKGGLFK